MNVAHFAVQCLGLVPYEQTWRLQEGYTDKIARGERPQTLLLLEYPHTYTFGRRGQIQNLLWDEAELSRRGITVQWVDRGGDVTYHGPGQLVGYPLLVLARGGLHAKSESGSPRLPQTDYVGYVRKLEGVIITALAQLGVASKRVKGLTGVWIPPAKMAEPGTLPAKIAAIGVKVDVNGVSRHGFTLNVDPDMSYWEGIVGCGLKDYPVTSLAKLLDPVPAMDQVIEAVIAAFEEVFEMRRLS
jgi:lipoate-protein ligase B